MKAGPGEDGYQDIQLFQDKEAGTGMQKYCRCKYKEKPERSKIIINWLASFQNDFVLVES